MKKNFYIFAATLLLLAIFNTSTLKAEDLPCNGNDPYAACTPPSNTALPINGGVVFLLIASIVIGIVTLSKTKAVKRIAKA